MDKPRIRLWGTAEHLNIFLVDGAEVRKSIDMQFATYAQPERHGYVPASEVWIDADGVDDANVETIAACAILEMERLQAAKQTTNGHRYDMSKMDRATMETLAKVDPDVAKLLNGGSKAVVEALAKDMTATDVHVSSSVDSGGGGLTIEEIQRRAKDQKPKKIDTDTGKVVTEKVDLRALLLKAKEAELEKVAVPRSLKMKTDTEAHLPFPVDQNALSNLSDVQRQRFLDAATKGEGAEDREVPIKTLVGLHDSIDPAKLAGMQAARDDQSSDEHEGASSAPIVAHFDRKNYLIDGHHRATLDYLGGASNIAVKYVDLNKAPAVDKAAIGADKSVHVTIKQSGDVEIATMPATAAVKEVTKDAAWVATDERRARIVKVDAPLKMIWGWANKITEGGSAVEDSQGDVIKPGELVRFTTDFMVDERVGKTNHQGDATHMVIHSFPMTYELAKAFGLQTDDEGWMVGVHAFDADTLAAAEAGDLMAFSIGGSGDRQKIG